MLTRIQRLLRSDERGYAYIMVLAFMALAVPLTVASLQLTSQLTVNAQLHQNRLTNAYSSGGALELALLEIRNNPSSPNDLVLDLNGGTTYVTITLGSTTSDLSKWAFSDSVLSLDVSGSVSASELLELQESANAIVDAFDLYTNSVRFQMGVVRFRGTAEGVVTMTNVDVAQTSPTSDHFSGIALHDGITGLQQGGPGLGSGTNIVAGIQGGHAQFSTGAGDRAEIPNILVVITDGDDTSGNTDLDIENAMLATGDVVIAVGVGAVNESTLDAIATDPDVGHKFYTSDFGGLLTLVGGIVDAVQSASLSGSIYDIEITSPTGAILQCRALLTLADELIVLSCE
ncbi:MAG: VWA domain-containing protein [Chloroflexi bacterium]|nr:VWA domain-containing protein [Chloroflexota bacterium]